jgi:hypothetical protein
MQSEKSLKMALDVYADMSSAGKARCYLLLNYLSGLKLARLDLA